MTTIAIDLGGTRIKIGIIKNGHILATTKIASEPDKGIEAILENISDAIRELLHTHSIPASALSGIGLSFPGIVDTERNRVVSKYVKYTNAHQFDFEAWAASAWKLPIVLANDAKAALIGEWAYGAGRRFNDIVLLTLGTGVGSAVMMEGRLLNGRHFLAGNMAGHMSINVNGQDCNCGFFGCLESEASTWALPEKISRHPLYSKSMLSQIEKIEFMHLFEGSDRQDQLARIVLEDCLKAWGGCAVNMVHAYDPDVIIIGGGIMKRKEDILPVIRKMVDEYAWLAPGTVKVVAAEQVEFAGLLGMDCLVSKLKKEIRSPKRLKKSNYDKFPVVQVEKENQSCHTGWESIIEVLRQRIQRINKKTQLVIIECYHGVDDEEVVQALQQIPHAAWISTKEAFKPEQDIARMVYPDVTDDQVFGYLTRLKIDDYFQEELLNALQKKISAIHEGTVFIYGTGASQIVSAYDLLVYADMARWEIQMRMRRNEVDNLGVANKDKAFSELYKQGFFVDWRVCDKLKKSLMNQWDFVLDTHEKGNPKLVEGKAILKGLAIAAKRPFRVVPFFDPGPWGGQWMKEVCDLDRSVINFAWGFDCVPEENSLLLGFGDHKVEIPSINLVFYQTDNLLGPKVHARFGDEFPIRFDFLDTMQGGNLSLQVHPITEYIQETFGMHYTQDESYYMLDAGEEACVYLGLREDVHPENMIRELKEAQESGEFNAEKHVKKWAVRKHDHVSIPAGTVHCSGAESMVLEISATPYIFTFKLWDWGRLGLDGKPRPINIVHGEKVIQWDRKEQWVEEKALNLVEPLAKGEGWREERTGLNELEFIETRRHWFTGKVYHHTQNIVNVLNLVEGREVIVESPSGAFEPFVVHYAETFIVPAAVGEYTIRPYGESEGEECATIKAFVRV